MTARVAFPIDEDGALLGATATDKVGFHGAVPTAQRAGADQAAVTTTAITSVTTTAATSTTPYGFATAAQADAIVTDVNLLITRVAALVTQGNELRAALVEKGVIKGSA